MRKGRKIADGSNTKLHVINVQQKCKWGKKLSKELENMLTISKNLDAQMLIFFSDNPIEILKDCIERRNIKNIILTRSSADTINFDREIHLKSDDIKIYIFE